MYERTAGQAGALGFVPFGAIPNRYRLISLRVDPFTPQCSAILVCHEMHSWSWGKPDFDSFESRMFQAWTAVPRTSVTPVSRTQVRGRAVGVRHQQRMIIRQAADRLGFEHRSGGRAPGNGMATAACAAASPG